MVDKNKQGEEYHYEEETPLEENQFEESTESAKSTKRNSVFDNVFDILNNRRVLVAIGLVVAIIIVAYIISPEDQQYGQQNITQQDQQTQQTQQTQQAQNAQQQQNQQQQPTQNQMTINQQQLQQLQDNQSKHAKNLSQVHQQLKAVNNKLNKMNNFSQQLTQSINRLSNKIDQLNQNQQQVVSHFQKQQKQQKQAKKQAKPKKTYHVRAIQPGMAWLQSSDGQSIVVKKGETIHNYGRVKMISPQKGVVATTSGAVFEYDE